MAQYRERKPMKTKMAGDASELNQVIGALTLLAGIGEVDADRLTRMESAHALDGIAHRWRTSAAERTTVVIARDVLGGV